MRIIHATTQGMCFGVRNALAVAERILRPDQVTIHGELVHNQGVNDQLRERGFHLTGESDRHRAVPTTDKVMITAHGISERERAFLVDQGKELIDATCPLVRRAHVAARALEADGYFVLVIGKPGHVEVEGIVGDLRRYEVVPNAQSVRAYNASRLGVIYQTTTAPNQARIILDRIRAMNPGKEIRSMMTICRPTRDRQEAVQALIEKVEAVVVIGGENSNNTRQLVDIVRTRGRPAFHVQGPEELDMAWFAGLDLVGLTAGASTPDAVIQAVDRRLHRIAATVKRKTIPKTSLFAMNSGQIPIS